MASPPSASTGVVGPPQRGRASSSVLAVSRTAKDALQAKYSAVVLAGYKPAPSKPDDDYDATTTTTTTTTTYRSWLEDMAIAANATKRQTPLVNAGYALRVACLLDQIDGFLRFHNMLKPVFASFFQRFCFDFYIQS